MMTLSKPTTCEVAVCTIKTSVSSVACLTCIPFASILDISAKKFFLLSSLARNVAYGSVPQGVERGASGLWGWVSGSSGRGVKSIQYIYVYSKMKIIKQKLEFFSFKLRFEEFVPRLNCCDSVSMGSKNNFFQLKLNAFVVFGPFF